MHRIPWPSASVKSRRAEDSRTNLSSNELHHPRADELVARLVSGFSPSALIRYPPQQKPVEAVAQLFGYELKNVLLVPGSDAAIRLLLASMSELLPGGIILQAPNYETWTDATDSAKWSIAMVRSEHGSEASSISALNCAAQQAARLSMVILSWPNGPAGYTPPWGEIERLRDICQQAGHMLVVDGCYAGFTGDPIRVAGLADDGCLVLISWSKLFGLAGGRLAACFGGAQIIEYLRASRIEDHVNALMLHAASRTASVYADFAEVWNDVAARRERLRRWLCTAGIAVPPSGANFLHLPMPDATSATWLSEALSDDGFRTRNMGTVVGLENHVRFTVACGTVGEIFTAALTNRLSELEMGRPEVLSSGPAC